MTEESNTLDNLEWDPSVELPEDFDPDLKSAARIDVREYTFMLYGQPGSGKTTMIGTFPRPILFFNPVVENSVRTLRGDEYTHYWDIRNADMLAEKINTVDQRIAEGKFPYRTVAVDSLSFLVDMLLSERRIARKGNLTQADWGMVANAVRDIVDHINGWPGCQKVWTAGVDTERDDLTGDVEGYPQMFRSLSRNIWKLMDVVLYMEAGKDLKTNKPSWVAHTARHRYFSARVRGAPVPGKILPTFDAVMELLKSPLYGTVDDGAGAVTSEE